MTAADGHHASFALPLEFLDIVVIEDSKPMQILFRSMLAPVRPRRIRVFDSFTKALQAMVNEPPNLIITEWRVGRHNGFRFLKMVRARLMAPLCFVPVVVVTGQPTQSVVERAMSGGAQLVLAKPISPTSLMERLQWLVADGRRYMIQPDGCFGIEGVQDKLEAIQSKAETLKQARAYQARLGGFGESPGKRARRLPGVAPPAAPEGASEPPGRIADEPRVTIRPDPRADASTAVDPPVPDSTYGEIVRRGEGRPEVRSPAPPTAKPADASAAKVATPLPPRAAALDARPLREPRPPKGPRRLVAGWGTVGKV